LWQPGLSGAPKLDFLKLKRDIQYVIPSVIVLTFSEKEEQSAEIQNMYLHRSSGPPLLIDTDRWCLILPPVSPERVLSVFHVLKYAAN